MVTISIQSLTMKLSFAQWFRLRRELAEVTQAQVAKTLGVRPQTVSNWEKGVSSPSLNPEQTFQLGSILNISLEELVRGFRGEVTLDD